MNDDAAEKALRGIRRWGRQTVLFAFSMKGQDLGKGLDQPGQREAAGAETKVLCEELWEAARQECKDAPGETPSRFVRKVFDWTHRHVYGERRP